jgi:hypothetical protein
VLKRNAHGCNVREKRLDVTRAPRAGGREFKRQALSEVGKAPPTIIVLWQATDNDRE